MVGAGAAGLACAGAVADLGLSVVVLEARDRVGGRILSLRGHPRDQVVEAGAQVVHGERALTWRVIGAAGLEAQPLPTGADLAVVVDGHRHLPADLDAAGLPRPWVAEQELLAGVGAGNGGERGGLLASWLAQVWCADAARLDVAAMARLRASATAGTGDFEVGGGYDLVAASLAGGLDVRLGAPVGRVAWAGAAGVTVGGPAGAWEARAVVVTVPPPVVRAGRIAFDPPLPAAKVAALEGIEVGDALTAVLTWSAPAPVSGWAFVADRPGAFWRAWAGSPVLVASFKGPEVAGARALVADHARVAEVAQVAQVAFPWAAGGEVERLQVVDWGLDAWAGGGFCYPTEGSVEAQRAWAAPLGGRLFFAGDAACGDRHPGTVHGALESGLRAAADVAAALGRA